MESGPGLSLGSASASASHGQFMVMAMKQEKFLAFEWVLKFKFRNELIVAVGACPRRSKFFWRYSLVYLKSI
jgi:hypothetical protein